MQVAQNFDGLSHANSTAVPKTILCLMLDEPKYAIFSIFVRYDAFQ